MIPANPLSIRVETRARWHRLLGATVIVHRAVVATSAGVDLVTEWTDGETLARMDAAKAVRMMRGTEPHRVGA